MCVTDNKQYVLGKGRGHTYSNDVSFEERERKVHWIRDNPHGLIEMYSIVNGCIHVCQAVDTRYVAFHSPSWTGGTRQDSTATDAST